MAFFCFFANPYSSGTTDSAVADSTAAAATETAPLATQTEETTDNSQNTSTDAANSANLPTEFSTEDADDASGAAIFSKDALTLSGTGNLTVNAYINSGIAGKTGVTVSSGTIDITGGTFTITSSAGKGISSHGNVTIDGEARNPAKPGKANRG